MIMITFADSLKDCGVWLSPVAWHGMEVSKAKLPKHEYNSNSMDTEKYAIL